MVCRIPPLFYYLGSKPNTKLNPNLHKTAYEFLKARGKDQGNLYRNAIIDISVGLARRRAELRLACQA